MRRTFLVSTIVAGFSVAILAPTAQAQIGIEIVVALAPPELPIYEQPPMPGPGFIWTPGYWAYAHENHIAPAAVQLQHQQAAAGNRALFQSVNQGQPPVAATSRANQFSGAGVVQARPAAASPAFRPGLEPRAPTPVQQAPTGPLARPPNETSPGLRPNEPPAQQAVPELRANEPTPHTEGSPRPRPAEREERK